ncbi:Jerky protein homolog-like [Frankliniella fusca]|uniref:Jerky protein homolog-like n=1 Tax=Frankliniella fusca TaxID=407009 RepID=A0AAE1LI00_9NEOP|nr:Jerky protein homolog-like [Frankliniella fusca]
MRALKPITDNVPIPRRFNTLRKKRVELKLEQKVEIVNRLEAGEKPWELAAAFDVSYDSIRRSRRFITRTKQFLATCRNKDRKRTKKLKYDVIDAKVHSWVLEKRAQGHVLPGPLIQEKAALLGESLGLETFKASNGWFQKFKRRHGVRILHIEGERLSANEIAATAFVGNFEEKIEKYDKRDVYNFDESGLFWKSVPTRTYVHAGETRADGAKVRKDRVTIGVCANATGCHRLPLLMIGKAKHPRALKAYWNHFEKMRIIYKHQPSSWTTGEIYTDWIRNYFIPLVEQRQKIEGRSGEILLLIDNCAAHKLVGEEADIAAINKKVQIWFLPANTTSLIQPMDQGIIIKLKRCFQKRFLRKVLECDEGLTAFYKRYDLNDCVNMVADSWAELTVANLRNAWRKLMPTTLPPLPPGSDIMNLTPETDTIVELLCKASGGITRDEVNEWLIDLNEGEAQVTGPDGPSKVLDCEGMSAGEDEDIQESEDKEDWEEWVKRVDKEDSKERDQEVEETGHVEAEGEKEEQEEGGEGREVEKEKRKGEEGREVEKERGEERQEVEEAEEKGEEGEEGEEKGEEGENHAKIVNLMQQVVELSRNEPEDVQMQAQCLLDYFSQGTIYILNKTV